MENLKQRKLQWIKKVVITLVMPLFLSIGVSFMFVTVWDQVNLFIDYGTIFFTQPKIEVVATSFQVNDRVIT